MDLDRVDNRSSSEPEYGRNLDVPDFSAHINGTIDATHLKIQKPLSEMWLAQIMRGSKMSRYKVPPRIQWLPCGCSRERTNESDPNNTWHVKRKGDDLFHKECGSKLKNQ